MSSKLSVTCDPAKRGSLPQRLSDSILSNGSNIPVDVLISHVLSEGEAIEDGFKMEGEGLIVRTRLSEESDIVEQSDEDKNDEYGLYCS